MHSRTCGEPKMPHIPGQEKFQGNIYHSSELDGKDAKGKRVAIIGGGASAVEALEFTSAAQAAKTFVLSRVSLVWSCGSVMVFNTTLYSLINGSSPEMQ